VGGKDKRKRKMRREGEEARGEIEHKDRILKIEMK
jgi:hypothetical protein